MKLVVPKDVKSRPIMSKLAVLVSALILHEIADSSSLTLDMQEAIGLSMSVMEVVARLGKLVGNMLGLQGEETDEGNGRS